MMVLLDKEQTVKAHWTFVNGFGLTEVSSTYKVSEQMQEVVYNCQQRILVLTQYSSVQSDGAVY